VPPRQLLIKLSIPLLLVLAGTTGYSLIEGWPVFDALYMTVTTLTTVGYREVHELSPAGRVFTMALLLGGVFTLFYVGTDVVRSIVTGELRSVWGRQIMERNLAALQGHLIVCGYGRMGRLVCQDFSNRRLPYVVIDKRGDALEGFALSGGMAFHGDATLDTTLQAVGIDRARALIAVVGTDADNLYITLSARLLNERLFIVARADDERADDKLQRAGANRVVSPYIIGGMRVAQAVLQPNVVDFIELATRTEHLELQIEEAQIGRGSALVGATVRDSRLRQELGLIVVAIKKPSGQMVFNPPPETALEAGDILIALGNRKKLDELDRLASG
jgi:voltage-gated potassium channel